MALTRDLARVPLTAGSIRMAITGGVLLDVGYLVEDSLKLTKDPITFTDENGFEHEGGATVDLSFEMLQGDYTTFQDLDALVGKRIDVEIQVTGEGTKSLFAIPFSYKMAQVFSNSKARTVIVTSKFKTRKLTNMLVIV